MSQFNRAEAYRGYVLAEREENRYDDSYFWLTVWNPESAEVEHFTYAATAWPSTPLGWNAAAELIAATPEIVKERAAQWQRNQERLAALRVLELDISYGKVFKGDKVRVARGRKVPRGFEGVVASTATRTVHTSRYGTWKTTEDYAFVIGENGAWEVAQRHLDLIERGPIKQQIFDLAC